jgi:hypothetical protein
MKARGVSKRMTGMTVRKPESRYEDLESGATVP